MPALNTIYDRTTINGGYGQSIVDWALGDDRVFVGDVTQQIGVGDTVTDVYLTLKANPNAPDALAIAQIHVTQENKGHGSTAPPGFIEMGLFSADYAGLVAAGPIYFLDFRVITRFGNTYTVSTAAVAFLQNVTQTNFNGTPGPIPMGPNGGQPRFRGYTRFNPMWSPPAILGVSFVAGDWYRNSHPRPGYPTGWVCIIGGSPGTWMPEGRLVGGEPFPTQPGLWAWNGATQSWEQTVSFPTNVTNNVYGYNPVTQQWVVIPSDGSWIQNLWNAPGLYWNGGALWLGDPMANLPTAPGQYVFDGSSQLWIPASQIQGVTNGSNALPGTIGEYVESYTSSPLTINTRKNEQAWDGAPLDQLLTLNLTAGDWFVTGNIDIEAQPGSGPTTYIAAELAVLPDIGEGEWCTVRSVTAQDWSCKFSGMRVNTVTPVTVGLLLEVVASIAGTPSGTNLIWANVRAWRVR